MIASALDVAARNVYVQVNRSTFQSSGPQYGPIPDPDNPPPVGTTEHAFHIKDGLIARETGYEIWRPDTSQ